MCPPPLRGSDCIPAAFRGLAPTAIFRRPYGGYDTLGRMMIRPYGGLGFVVVARSVGLRPRLDSVAPSGLGFVVFPLPWVCTHGYFPSSPMGTVFVRQIATVGANHHSP